MWKAPEPLPCPRHSQNVTRLRCSHCETPICPQCMVQTEVGFKCPTCINQQQSHLYQASPLIFALLPLLSALIGYGYGYVHSLLMSLPIRFLGIPLLGLLMAFSIGKLAGRGILNLLRYKRHASFGILLTLGYCIGLALGPYQLVFLRDIAMIQGMVMSGAGNVLETGSSSIFGWLALAGDFLLPFLLYDGLKRTFKQ